MNLRKGGRVIYIAKIQWTRCSTLDGIANFLYINVASDWIDGFVLPESFVPSKHFVAARKKSPVHYTRMDRRTGASWSFPSSLRIGQIEGTLKGLNIPEGLPFPIDTFESYVCSGRCCPWWLCWVSCSLLCILQHLAFPILINKLVSIV